MSRPSTISYSREQGVAILEFDADHEMNPFSQPRMRELLDLIEAVEDDDTLGAIVLYGGDGRSFAAGGDFKETSEFSTDGHVDSWIDHITDLYTGLLRGRKPIIAAVDGFCIGLGLQIALCADMRIGSTESTWIMPELKLGIACTFGGYMLETVVGRSVMQAMVFTSEPWSAQRALSDGLVHELHPSDDVRSIAVARAAALASWTTAAVQSTRPQVNEGFVDGLEHCRQRGKTAHRAAFGAGEAQVRMKAVLNGSKER